MPDESEHLSNPNAWQAIAGSWDVASPFGAPDWFTMLHDYCLAEYPAHIVSERNGDDAVALPLMAKDGALQSLSNWYSFHWRPLVAGDERATAPLLNTLLRNLKNVAPRLVFSPVPTEDGSANRLETALRQAGWRVAVDTISQNHWLETKGRSFDDWWAERPGVLRSTVKRKAKKGLVTLSITSAFSDADWDDFETVYRQSWKPPESHPKFLRERARLDAEQGMLRLGIARIEGAPVAAQYWVTAYGTAHIQKLAHVADHDALSPGTLLTHALFRHAFDVDHVHRVDFGTGDDGYKRDWMEDDAPLVTIRAWDGGQPAAWPSLLRHGLSRVAARLRGR